MITVSKLSDIPPMPPPIALTVGTFDGVHLGHQRLFKRLKELGTSVVITFSNHPQSVLQPKEPLPLLTPFKEKIALLRSCAIDLLVILEFTLEFSKMPYDVFLREVHKYLLFSYLVLGDKATFGYNREGNRESSQALAHELQFQFEYMDKLMIDDHVVSSGRIRKLISENKIADAEKLLGRKIK